ncbi:MAG: ABC transporter ATP-binding protein [Deltaproteobacteria bacterium]|nr:ABC transporter ATP-binding protein [Deltaproteobacteria bacterium]MBW2342974.1 ABC transporter ATP-binding protein [Deltaproteobacteria bacterium]
MENDDRTVLKVSKLEVVYHHVSTAIQGVSFNVSDGELFALIGANGAGKTTTLRAISGFLRADNADITDGEIIFLGQKLNRLAPHKITSMGIALVPERNKVFETLTTDENLAVSVSQSRERKQIERTIYEYFPRLKTHKNHLAGFLSGGERQMLAIGQALLCAPRLLLLDEVSMGLAPLIVSDLLKTLVQMKDDLDLTILLVEQNAAAALDIANYAAVMENGRIVFDGTSQKLLAHDDVREFYLGLRKTGEQSYTDIKQYKRSRRWWG